jgi:hypothetical protein
MESKDDAICNYSGESDVEGLGWSGDGNGNGNGSVEVRGQVKEFSRRRRRENLNNYLMPELKNASERAPSVA